MKSRESMGNKATMIAIISNIILAALNFVVGTIAGSTALIAGAADNMSDVLASIITAVAFKIGLKPADSKHPYGHGRAEPIAGLIVAGFLFIVAYEILIGAVSKLVSPHLTAPDMIAAYIAIIAVVINFIIAKYLLKCGNEINSPAIISVAANKKADVYTSLAIFLGILGSKLGYPILDPSLAILVSILVIKTAYEVARNNIDNIMGKISEKLYADLYNETVSIQGVHNVCELKINAIGSYYSLDIEVLADPNLSFDESFNLSEYIESHLIQNFKYIQWANVHVIPENEKE